MSELVRRMGKSSDDRLWELLCRDHADLQATIRQYDDHRTSIKLWMITASSALLAAVLAIGQPFLGILGVVVVVLFALAEVYFISVQEDVIARAEDVSRTLEAFARGGADAAAEYRFGMHEVEWGGRLPSPGEAWRWLGYRTFNPVLYGGLIIAFLVVGVGVLAVSIEH